MKVKQTPLSLYAISLVHKTEKQPVQTNKKIGNNNSKVLCK